MKSKTSKTQLKPGDRVSTGGIFVAISPETGSPMYCKEVDEECATVSELLKKFGSNKYPLSEKNLKAWRLPTHREIKLFQNIQDCTTFRTGLDADFKDCPAHYLSRDFAGGVRGTFIPEGVQGELAYFEGIVACRLVRTD